MYTTWCICGVEYIYCVRMSLFLEGISFVLCSEISFVFCILKMGGGRGGGRGVEILCCVLIFFNAMFVFFSCKLLYVHLVNLWLFDCSIWVLSFFSPVISRDYYGNL